MYRFQSQDRTYTQWVLEDMSTGEQTSIDDVEPAECKWFTGDVLTVANGKYSLVTSPVRSGKAIPGVLALSGATYGRNTNGKLLYKCYPDDHSLPVFLAPYANKKVGFSKKSVDQYVTFEYRDWDEKHPRCAIIGSIGPVNDNEAFYEYQLHRKGLVVPRRKKRYTDRIVQTLSAKPIDEVVKEMSLNWGFSDRTDEWVFTIDPEGCRDFDDAIGWRKISGGQVVSVYISNVAAWLEHLDHWKYLDHCLPASVYLPHRVVPMLIEFLSTNLCSLVEGRLRPVLAMDITLLDMGGVTVDYCIAIIRVGRNYRYENNDLAEDTAYRQLLTATAILQRESPYVSGPIDSHTLVAYYMIFMNHRVAEVLNKAQSGISRAHKGEARRLDSDIGRVIDGYQWGGAMYVRSGGTHDTGHGLIGGGLNHYTHITSPIRRGVDLANMVVLQSWLGLMSYGEDAHSYVREFDSNLTTLNGTYRNISRVQSDSNMLHLCTSSSDILGKLHDGVVVDVMPGKDAIGGRYTVYLEGLETLYHMQLGPGEELLERYSRHRFSIYLFKDERTLSRKIRLGVVS